MKTVTCPICGNDVIVDVSKAIDENAEFYLCDRCHATVMYAGR